MQMIDDGPVYPMLHWIQQSFFHGTKNRKYVHVTIQHNLLNFINIGFFKIQMLCYWPASQEGFTFG
jgi:hypothetical protein